MESFNLRMWNQKWVNPLGNAIFCDLELTFKVDLDFISDLDLTHSMVLIPINGIILGEIV